MRPSILAGLLGGDRYMFSSNRVSYPKGTSSTARVASTAGNEYCASQSNHTNVPYATKGLMLGFVGWYVDGNTEVNLGNDRPILGISIVINGTRYPLPNSSFTVPNGGHYIFTDDSIQIPANANYYIIINDYVPAGQYRAGSIRANSLAPYSGEASGDRVVYGASSMDGYLTQGGTAFGVINNGAVCWAPHAICTKGWWAANGKPPVSLIVGDSRGNGDRDAFYDVPVGGMFGSEARALNDNASSTRRGFWNACVPGSSFTSLSSGSFAKRAAFLAAMGNPFSKILCEMGINDAGGAQTNAPAAYSYLSSLNGSPIVQVGILPYVDSTAVSTYGYTDSTRMTIHADMQSFNEWCKNTLGGGALAAFIDNRGIIDTSAGSGKPNGSLFSSTIAVDYVSGSSLVLNAQPAMFSVLYAQVGTASFRRLGVVNAIVNNGNGTYTCTFRNGVLTGTLTAGTVICDQQTEDGLHYFTEPTIRLMAPIIAAKNAGLI